MSWVGARGVVPLAAALSLPLVTAPARCSRSGNLVLFLTTAVIVSPWSFRASRSLRWSDGRGSP